MTDEITFRVAKGLVMSYLAGDLGLATVVDARRHSVSVFADLVLVAARDGAAFVHPDMVSARGRLLFDEVAYRNDAKAASDHGEDPDDIALYGKAVPLEHVVIDRVNAKGERIVLAVADGDETFVLSVVGGRVNLACVGPASIMEFFRNRAGPVGEDGLAVAEIMETFGASAAEAAAALDGFAEVMNDDLCTRVLEAMGYVPPVNAHGELDMVYGVAAFVAANESAARYCLDRFPNVELARRTVSRVESYLVRKAELEATPAP